MIINIRGTSGSGKGWVVKNWLNAYAKRPIKGVLGDRDPEAYECIVPEVSAPVYVIGPYLTPCGGCDAILPYSLVVRLLNKYAARGHVVFEGLLISTCWGEVGKFLEARGPEAVVLYLNTPIEDCIEWVQKRRKERGAKRPLAVEKTRNKFEVMLRQRQKVAKTPVTLIEASAQEAQGLMVKLFQTGAPLSSSAA